MDDTYTLFRQFADSWMLLAMFLFFGAAVFWVFRPGARKLHDESANIPFRNEDAPAAAPRQTDTTKGESP